MFKRLKPWLDSDEFQVLLALFAAGILGLAFCFIQAAAVVSLLVHSVDQGAPINWCLVILAAALWVGKWALLRLPVGASDV